MHHGGLVCLAPEVYTKKKKKKTKKTKPVHPTKGMHICEISMLFFF